ncbi:MAG: T9SS type A sorting domain-containing protein [Ignavibacteriaceae bacterium]
MFFDFLNSKKRAAIFLSLAFVTLVNAQTWQKVPEVDSVDVLSIVNHNNILFSSTLYNIYLSSNGGENWQPVASLPNVTSDFNVLFSFEDHLYVGTNGDGVYRTSNNGEVWNSFSPGLTGFAKFVTSFTVLGDSLYVGTDGAGVYSINLQNPINWIAMNNGLVNFGVTALTTSGNYIVAGSGLYLHVKERTALQWQNVFVDSILIQRHYFTFQLFNEYLFAGTDNGVYRGSLDAQTWERTDITFFPGRDIVSMIPLGDQLLVALLYQGQHWLFSTRDNGLNWETKAHEFSFLWDMMVFNNKLWAGRSDGLWYIDISNWTDVSNDNPIKLNDFRLEQNYPNPFNPSTSIQYAIGSRQFVQLKVYDVLGNEIATLVNEEKPAGEYKVEFSANIGLASGIYFYQLTVGDNLETKKMILIK